MKRVTIDWSVESDYILGQLHVGGQPVDDAYVEIRLYESGQAMQEEEGIFSRFLPSFFDSRPCGYLTGIELPTEWQGKGLGQALEQGALKQAAARGAKTVWLVSTANAVSFHEAQGFMHEDAGPMALMSWSPR